MECRALIREMHEAEQSLKAWIKQANQATEEVRIAASDAVDEDIASLVEKALLDFGKATQQAMKDTSDKIIREFDKLANPLLESLDDFKHTFEKIERTQARIRAVNGDTT